MFLLLVNSSNSLLASNSFSYFKNSFNLFSLLRTDFIYLSNLSLNYKILTSYI